MKICCFTVCGPRGEWGKKDIPVSIEDEFT